MILSCPVCETRYRLDDAAISAAGRNVRCKSCAYVWRATPPNPEGGRGGGDPVAEPVKPEESLGGNAAPSADEDYPAVPFMAEPVATPPLSTDDAFEPRFTSPMRGPVPETQTSKGSSRRLLIGWVVLAAIVVVAVAGLAIFRVQFVRSWPPAGRLYAAIGWPVEGGYGLQLSGVNVAPSVDNGKSVLLVTGKIADISSVVLAIPKLHVFLLSDNRQILRQFEMDAGKPELHPGEATSFSLSITDPPREAASVRIAFAGAAPGL